MLELIDETPRAKTIVLEMTNWTRHCAGQHVDLRLTAEDGYQAQRGYSIASAPEDSHVFLTVERLERGEVSQYLVDELREGDELELRGPIGGYFVWDQSLGGPLLLIAGGTGIVPFRAMLRHWASGGGVIPARLLYSSRSLEDVIYREELLRSLARDGLDVQLTLTRAWPHRWDGHRGRVDQPLVDEIAWPPEERPLIYVCGPSAFVETVAATLSRAGHMPSRIRTERFGPTGT